MVGISYNTAILQREHFVWRPSLWFTKGEPRVLEKEILCENLFVWFTVQRKRLASSFLTLGWPREDSWKGSKDKFSLI